MTKLLACLPALAVAGLLSAPARAQTTATPAQAQALQDQIQSALESLAGARAKRPTPWAQVSAVGDHYQLSVPLAPLVQGLQPATAAFTAELRPLPAGGWAVDDEQYPSEFEIVTHQATPPPTQSPAQPGNNRAGDVPPSATYQVKLGAQDEHATLDPAGLVVSSSSGTIASADIVKTGGLGASLTHLGRISNQSSTRPSTPGHFDVLADVAVAGYAAQFADPDMVRSEINAERLHVAATMTGLSAVGLRQVSLELSQAPRWRATSALTPEQRAQLRQVVLAARELLTGAQLDEEADGLKFDIAGHRGALQKIELTLAGQAPQDMLSASMGITLEGLTLAELPPAIAAYLPSRIAFRPTVSNLSVTDLTKLALDDLDPPSPPPGQSAPPVGDYQALFSHGGIQVGFDQLALDLAGAQFAGTGSFTLTGPQTLTGAAQITAHGLDDLVTRLQADPAAAQAAPVILLLKGIAKTTPDGAVWQVTVQDRKVLVNGLDLGAMAAAMK